MLLNKGAEPLRGLQNLGGDLNLSAVMCFIKSLFLQEANSSSNFKIRPFPGSRIRIIYLSHKLERYYL